MGDENENVNFDLDETVSDAKKETAKVIVKPKAEVSDKEIETAKQIVKNQLSKPEEQSKKKTVNELLDELFLASVDARQKKILEKYRKELASFEESLGKKDFLQALGQFMTEQIEGKLLAAKSNKK